MIHIVHHPAYVTEAPARSTYRWGKNGAIRDLLRARGEDIVWTEPELIPPAWLEANWGVYEAAIAAAPVTPEARQVVRERIDALLSFDGSADIAALPMPTLVLGARDDMIVPSFLQEELAAALPGGRSILLDSGGHFFPVSRPDAFTAKVVEWIGELA